MNINGEIREIVSSLNSIPGQNLEIVKQARSLSKLLEEEVVEYSEGVLQLLVNVYEYEEDVHNPDKIIELLEDIEERYS